MRKSCESRAHAEKGKPKAFEAQESKKVTQYEHYERGKMEKSLPFQWSVLQLLSDPFSWQRFILASAVVTMLTDVKRWIWIFANTVSRDLK